MSDRNSGVILPFITIIALGISGWLSGSLYPFMEWELKNRLQLVNRFAKQVSFSSLEGSQSQPCFTKLRV